MGIPDIGIFVDRRDQFFTINYLIRLIAEAWRAYGITVHVIDDLDNVGAVGTALLHHDRTRIPASVARRLLKAGPVLNGQLRDISKRAISRHVVGPMELCATGVIVKSNRNYGGQPELRDLRERHPLLARAVDRLPWTMTGLLDPGHYPIYDVVGNVPWLARINRALVVEQFLPERRDGLYCLRQYLFLGDKEVNTLLLGPHPVVKASNVVAREDVPEVPLALRQIRTALKADFGRIDYVLRDGKVVVFDVNRTPGFDPANRMAPLEALVERLAPGILTFLGEGAPATAAAARRSPGCAPGALQAI